MIRDGRDFEVIDGGAARSIADFRADITGVSVAMLFFARRAQVS